MSCKSLTMNGLIQTGTAALMVGASVLAQVGAKFFALSVLPTAAQLGSECLATLSTGALPLVGCALVALGVDILVGKFLKKIMPNYEQTAYLLKRVVTIAVVIGMTLALGSSSIAAIAIITVFIVRDIICVARNESKKLELIKADDEFKFLNNLKADLKHEESLKQNHVNDIFEICRDTPYMKKMNQFSMLWYVRMQRVISMDFPEESKFKKEDFVFDEEFKKLIILPEHRKDVIEKEDN